MAYDPVHGQLVLFGGIDSNVNPFNDTWLWDGANWTKQSPKTSPSARWTHAMVYDPVHHQVVLFGGQSMTSTPILDDTWVWDGSNWTQMTPQTKPAARFGHAMVFDATHGQAVLFGGVGIGQGAPDLNDTWTWDGANWTKQSPSSSPPARHFAAAAYDSGHGQMVLFGGHSNETGNPFGDTWVWDGSNWAQKSPATSPAAREVHGLAFDAAHGQTVLFGGFVTNSSLDNGTWTWDGANWTQQSPASSPKARSAFAMAYDSMHSQVVLFGGYAGSYVNETWIWSGASAPPVPAVTGTISLVTPAASNVHVGDSLLFELDLSNTGSVVIANLSLNVSNPTGGLAFDQPAFGSCTVAPPGFNCTGLADLGTSASAKYTFTATATGAGAVTDAAMLTFNNPPQTFMAPPLNLTVQPAAGQPVFTARSKPWRGAFTPNSAVVKGDSVIATDVPFPFDPTIPGGIFTITPQDATATALGLPGTVYPAATLLTNLSGNGPNDVVILDSAQSTAFIILNVTGGSAPSFSSATALTGFASAGLTPSSMAAFQDPNTGFTDLAIIDLPSSPGQAGEIAVASNDGAGNLGKFAYYPASGAAGNLIGMDFNNDALQDLAFLDSASNSIGVMLDGVSGFSQPVLTSLGGATPIAMAAGDFNGDGFTDLAVLTTAGVNIFLGAGDGTFRAGATVTVPDPGPIASLQPGLMVVADFNADGNLDLAVASPRSNLVTILSGDGHGNFGTPAPYAAANPIALAAGTLAGTSNPSLAVINGPSGSTPGNVSILVTAGR